jgi:hypothetical protein
MKIDPKCESTIRNFKNIPLPDNRPEWRKEIDPHNRWLKTFMGQGQQHTYWLYKVIDDVFKINPQIKKVIELGTGSGALSIVLGLHAIRIEDPENLNYLITIDHKVLHHRIKRLFHKLDIRYYNEDIFSPISIGRVCYHIQNKACFIFCDGGDKKREFNFYAPIVPPGSVIAAHDWTREIKMEHIEQTVKEQNLIPLFEEEWNREPDYIRTCFWKKTAG